ncbi:MAG: radical SAM protein [Bryobacteraceae bacterium]
MEQITKQLVALQPRNASTGDLVRDIHSVLLSDFPDLVQLHAWVGNELNLSSEDARRFIYQLVAELNSALFPAVTHIELIHTEGCNLACSYCFEKNMLGYRRMPLDIAQAAIDLLFKYSHNEPDLHITHFGGEPTLNFPAIRHATEYAEQTAALLGKSVNFDMTSNGVLFTESMVEYFAQHKIMVLLSVDGLGPTHDRYRVDKRGRGTFDGVMKGLSLLKKVQPWIGVKMTVMPQNAPSLFEDVLGLHDRGVNQFIIGYATGVKWSEEERECFRDQLSRVVQWYQRARGADLRIDEFENGFEEASSFGCQAGRVSVTATVDGEVSPCSKILALNNKQLLAKLGDVRYGLTHIRNRAELVSCSKLRSACETNGIAEEFHGGCFAENYEDNHDLFEPSMQGHVFSIVKRSACSGCSANRGS